MDRVLVQDLRRVRFSRGPHASPEMSDKGSLPVIEGSRDVGFPPELAHRSQWNRLNCVSGVGRIALAPVAKRSGA